MRKPRSPVRRQLIEMDAVYNHWCPRRPIERLQDFGQLSGSMYVHRNWVKAFKFFGSSCDRFGLTQTAKYIGISREDGAWIFRCYRKQYEINERLELLKIACNVSSRVYNPDPPPSRR